MAPPQERKVVATNRAARFEYHIGDVYEAGIVLTGTEVKSLRTGKANIKDSYATISGNEAWLINAHIDEYKMGNRHNHNPTRHRKLLFHRNEIKKLTGVLKTSGVTMIPLNLYFNEKGHVKLEVGVATGKKKFEKREAIKDRDWKREQGRLLKN